MFQTDSKSRLRRPMSWIFFLIIAFGLIGVACSLLGGADPAADSNNNVTSEQGSTTSDQGTALTRLMRPLAPLQLKNP